MQDSIAKIAEQKIREAIENGELDNLPGKGKPLKLDDMREVPPELRLEYKVLKNAGLLPEEVTVKKEITALEELLQNCRDTDEAADLKRQIVERTVYYNILLDKRRKRYSGR
ncbi:MAG: DUF1992 domain-containing protein [Negativicutes bacterium]|nr:DUF1992 domain-containing protein [Negativicutes bacterium]